MAARDTFRAELQCPECGRTGVAKLSELDGWAYMNGDKSTSVDYLPDGFTVVDQPSSKGTVDIYCADCGVSAI